MQMYPAKNRFILIPDSWCKAIEKVTGTSGLFIFNKNLRGNI